MSNELEEAMDRMLAAQQLAEFRAHEKRIEESGAGRIEYADGKIIFIPAWHREFKIEGGK